MNNENIWNICLKEAQKALKHGDVPVGALIVKNNKIIVKSHNTRQKKANILNHAEINAIKKISKRIKNWNLNEYDLFVTLKPCSMCMEIIKQSRIKNVYYLLDKEKYKKEYNKTTIIKKNCGNLEQKYHLMLTNFFKQKR